MASQQMEIIAKVLEQSAKLVEEQVDAQISKLNEMDDDDFERLKERRLEALRKAQKQKEVWSRTFRDIFVVNGWTKKSSATILQEMYLFFFLCWKPFSNYLTMFPKSLYTCDRICCVFFFTDFGYYCFCRSGYPKAMASTEKLQMRKTFSARWRIPPMLSATSTKTLPLGKVCKTYNIHYGDDWGP